MIFVSIAFARLVLPRTRSASESESMSELGENDDLSSNGDTPFVTHSAIFGAELLAATQAGESHGSCD